MNKLTEEQLLELVRKERPKLPDFEAMWERIQAKQANTNQQNSSAAPSGRNLTRSRKRLIPLAIAASSVIVAAPVVAGVSMGWPVLFDRLGVTTAMESGFGNPLDITVTSAGASLALHGVVTDDQRLDVMFTFDVPSLPDYDHVDFEHQTLTNLRGEAMPLKALIRKDTLPNRMIGLLETDNGLGNKREQLKLSLKNLVFYKYKDTELDASPMLLKDGDRVDSRTRFGTLQVVSTATENGVLTLRYEIPISGPEDSNSHPGMFLKVGEKRVKSSYSATLPTEKSGIQLRQDIFRLPNPELNSAKLYFTHLDVIQTLSGTWDASFEADGRKASQAMFRKPLDPAAFANDSDMGLKELVVTPLEVRLLYDDKLKTKSPDLESVYYDTKQLMLNGKTINGGSWSTEKSGGYFRFQLPEWSKDLSQAPMKLLLSDARITRCSKAWQPLETPSDTKRTIDTKLDQFPVTFTYYKEGDDLVVESYSTDPDFIVIYQTSVKRDVDIVYPEMNPTPPGGNGTSKKVDRYPGLLSKPGKLELSPGFYHFKDGSRRVELKIN
ncbi:DUF4179 domain-containing protein [Paenibacillus sp. MZ04-78.2]|uniref:DUF4179 domain-containing protein n=1 Tax=Paenibacillus sp. MZ04-78.2 TaxID=2962034 RepID=UPI0020B6C92B|nr:DUF4179 domain-containing protein [Paenibacillus sp. MZ04-78.2]MCP3772327.1 DUF4179 domain-containing protein [Paenibacillus sp. MZ04-78.2]